MVRWHHQLNGPEFEQALGVGEGQGSLVCCSPQSCKELDTTQQLNNNVLLPDLNIDSNQMYALSAENAAIQMAYEHFISIKLKCHYKL